MPQNVPDTSSSTSQKVINPNHGDMEPLHLCQDAAQELSLCPGLLYLHQNPGISDLPQPADASGLPEVQELQMVAHWKNSWLQMESCPVIFNALSYKTASPISLWL